MPHQRDPSLPHALPVPSLRKQGYVKGAWDQGSGRGSDAPVTRAQSDNPTAGLALAVAACREGYLVVVAGMILGHRRTTEACLVIQVSTSLPLLKPILLQCRVIPLPAQGNDGPICLGAHYCCCFRCYWQAGKPAVRVWDMVE